MLSLEKPDRFLEWMEGSTQVGELNPPSDALRSSGYSSEAPTPGNLNWILKNLGEWTKFLASALPDYSGRLSLNIPSSGGSRVFVTESEEIREPIVITQPDTYIQFAPGISITALDDVSSIIVLAAPRITVVDARLGFRSSVVQSDTVKNMAISRTDEANHCIVDRSRIYNLQGKILIQRNIEENATVIEGPING